MATSSAKQSPRPPGELDGRDRAAVVDVPPARVGEHLVGAGRFEKGDRAVVS